MFTPEQVLAEYRNATLFLHIYITALFQLIKKGVCDHAVNFAISAIITKKHYTAYESHIYVADWHYI